MKPGLRSKILPATSTALKNDLEAIEGSLRDDEFVDEQIEQLEARLTRLVDGIAAASRELIERDDPADAEALFAPILSEVRRSSEQERISAALDAFERGQNPQFVTELARWLSHVPTEIFVRQSEKLDGKVLGGGARVELGEVLARLWHEATEEQLDIAERGFLQIGALHRDGAAIELARLGKEMEASLLNPLFNEEAVDQQRPRTALVQRLSEFGLLDAGEAADLLLESVKVAMAEAPGVEAAALLASFLQEVVEWAAPRAAPGRVESTRAALDESTWLAEQSPQLETLHLQLAAAMASEARRAKSPYSSNQIKELVKAYGSSFVPGVILWLLAFRPPPDRVASSLWPMLVQTMPPSLIEALRSYAEKLSPTGRFRLIERVARRPVISSRLERNLQLLGIAEADPKLTTVLILKRFKEATANRHRESTLRVWRAFDPDAPAVRRKLINEVFIPIAKHGVGGYELARKYLSVAKDPPRGTKGKLLKALENKDRSRAQRRRMRKRVEEFGLKPAKD
jgi:hypothetical protein